jgi:hypothetical protein
MLSLLWSESRPKFDINEAIFISVFSPFGYCKDI